MLPIQLRNGQTLIYNNTTSQWEPGNYTFPQLLVDASRTTTYTPAVAYAVIPYNTTAINVGTSYNTTSGNFTAPAAGTYQIIVNNSFSANTAANHSITTRIIVNGTTDTESSCSASPYAGSGVNITSSPSSVVNLTAGQTVNIQIGGEVGTVTALTGTRTAQIKNHQIKLIQMN
jgi:hypothetical protein